MFKKTMGLRRRVIVFVIFITAFITVHCDMNDKDSYGKCNDGIDKVFNCSGVGFVVVPPEIHIPNYMTQLDLSNNQLTNISFNNYTILGDSLEKLYLGDNHISYMEANGFMFLTSLEYLDLSGNLLNGENIERKSFDYLRSLKTLIMERNPLTVIKEDTFDFMELPNVVYLDLSHSNLEDIESGGIDLPSLRELDLSWNRLTTFHPDSFRMLVELRILDLSHNRFVVFDHLPNLPEIRTINLDSNSIQTVNISDDVWKLADSLERLYMRNNDVIRFTRDSFPWNLDTLTEVRLENNKIQCDCRMRWFKEANYDFTDRNISIPCQFPVDLRGINILDVSPDDFTCSVPLWEILLLSGLVTVGLVVCSMSLYIIIQKKCRRKKTRKPNAADDHGGNYTAVFTREDDDARVAINDDRSLLQNDKEFDV